MKKYQGLFFALTLLWVASRASAAVGDADPGFTTGTGFTNTVNPPGDVVSVAVQNDGKIVVGGKFTTFNGNARSRIARLNHDGSVDSLFTVGTGITGGAATVVSALAVLPDGKILIGGNFNNYSGTPRNAIARLTSAGALDTSFTVPSTIFGGVNVLRPLSDGKVLVGGTFNNLSGAQRNGIGRLTSTGPADPLFGFDLDEGEESTILQSGAVVHAIVVDSQNRLVIAGGFTTVNGGRINVARLTADGLLDSTFTLPSGTDGTVRAMVMQPDGKLIIGGDFNLAGGQTKDFVTRLLPDGALDPDFNVDQAPNSSIYSIALQGDGKIIIAGDFNRLGEEVVGSVARLNIDGTVDTTFAPIGANSLIFGAVAQPDGDIVLGGAFTTYNGAAARRIVRLDGESQPLMIKRVSGPAASQFVVSLTAEVGRNYSIDYSDNLQTWTQISFTSTNFTTLVTNNFGSATHRFYRASLLP